MRLARRLLLVWMVMLLLAACARGPIGGARGQPEAITIAMGFIPNVQFTPMYVAIEKGYFAEEGLKVELDYGMETDLLKRLGTNDLQFVLGSGDQVILARANDLPVKYFFHWYRRFPVCVVSMADQGIVEPGDLVGKTVGIPVTEGASYIGWLAFLDQVGIASDRVSLQAIGYTQVASLVEGRVDAAVCYALNEPVQLAEGGYAINTFYLDQYTSLVSNGLITNDETLKKQPKVVRGVARAFSRGLADTIADPDAAFEIARKAIPEMDDEAARLQRAVLQNCIDFWQGEPLGASEEAAWQESIEFLLQIGLIS
ncbi:MAG: ABC transporter substrate-binding protein, partial [Anaerolineae bacterium]|nr:ABC transporter substrate-binding protein [Anaerolineae bacterium]